MYLKTMTSNFDRIGLGSTADLLTQEWKKTFKLLEQSQKRFLSTSPHPASYPWPIDPLHNFSRVWEYPYVYHHLNKYISEKKGSSRLTALDVGSGLTFFPLAVADLGYKCIALDNIRHWVDVYNDSRHKSDNVIGLCRVASDTGLGSKSVDVVYSVSVLEHIPSKNEVIKEMHRVLKDDGLLILTFDLNINDNKVGINKDEYESLSCEINKYFKKIAPEITVHPQNVIDTENTLYPLYSKLTYWEKLKNAIFDRKSKRYNLTTMGLVLGKK